MQLTGRVETDAAVAPPRPGNRGHLLPGGIHGNGNPQGGVAVVTGGGHIDGKLEGAPDAATHRQFGCQFGRHFDRRRAARCPQTAATARFLEAGAGGFLFRCGQGCIGGQQATEQEGTSFHAVTTPRRQSRRGANVHRAAG